jgi:hypothetical protein
MVLSIDKSISFALLIERKDKTGLFHHEFTTVCLGGTFVILCVAECECILLCFTLIVMVRLYWLHGMRIEILSAGFSFFSVVDPDPDLVRSETFSKIRIRKISFRIRAAPDSK